MLIKEIKEKKKKFTSIPDKKVFLNYKFERIMNYTKYNYTLYLLLLL